MDKITTTKLKEFKKRGQKITMLTAYDYNTAKILNEAGIDAILIGDSLGMVKLGYENTLPVTLEDIIYHTRAVARGNTNALLIADMPFMSYGARIEDSVMNAGKCIKDGYAHSVKLEGGKEIIPTIKAIINAKVPVIGHIGLTPQAINQLGGYKVQGRNSQTADKLINTAKELEEAGIFALVLECIPEGLAKEISEQIAIPTIGIGAGKYCDGQILVIDDILGMYSDIQPKFVKKYADLRTQILRSVKEYIDEVKNKRFPSEEHVYK